MIKSLAELKRKVKVGTKIKLVEATTAFGLPHKYLGSVRAVDKVQSNAIRFEGGSYLYWPKASNMTFEENGFSIEEGNVNLTYEFVE
jgi:hypothetical protein